MERTYNVLLTYDIDSRHTEVRNTLIEEYGFKDIIIGNNGTRCYLPNTTLLKRNTTKEDVHNIIKNVCKMLNANLKKDYFLRMFKLDSITRRKVLDL